MKISRSVTQGFLVAGSLLLAIGLLTGTAQAGDWFTTEITVNCAEGDTIARALRRGRWAQLMGKPFIVNVRGTCHEYVTIKQDDVTLQGRPEMNDGVEAPDPPDPDRPMILIEGARRVVIDYLTVSRGKDGISAVLGAGFTVQNSTIHDNDRGGIRVAGSSAVIVDNRIHHNFDGVKIVESASARIWAEESEDGGNTIAYNEEEGIEIANSSTASMFGNTVEYNGTGIGIFRATGRLYGENTIQENTQNGILVATGGALRQGPLTPDTISDKIQNNIDRGIRAISSFLDIRDAIIMGNGSNGISLDFHSTLLIRNSKDNTEISGNTANGIGLSNDSGLWLINPPVEISGHGLADIRWADIQCYGDESSIDARPGATDRVDAVVNCTGF